MIAFDLTDEQNEIRELAHRFAEQEIRPIAAEHDETEDVPWDVLRTAAQTGLLSYFVPEEYGGGGICDALTHCLVKEELFWGCAGVGTIIGGNALSAKPILLAGTEAQKRQYLSRFCDPNQPVLGAFALTEPEAGSDPARLKTQARRVGDEYIINGNKTFITNGGIADINVIFANVDPDQGRRGITAFIVEKDWPGFIPGKKEKKMGIRASHTATLTFEDLRVPVANRLGQEGKGFKLAMQTFETTRTHVAIGAVGLARAAYEYALQYAQERIQFGEPIMNHQAVSFMIADMATQIDAARLLCWRAAYEADQGRYATEAASMAKAFAADVAMKVTTDAVQVLGGYGYMRDYPVEKWMRDAKIMQIYEGTAQIQRLIIARHLTRG
jgi:alkylation response protein AidB-like acyl-CoA dehydrogenase